MSAKTPKFFLIGFLTILTAASPLWAEDAKPTILSATPSYAAVFKNGVGLVVSPVKLPAPSGVYQITPFPEATLGSFWIQWGDGVRLDRILATQTEKHESVPASNIHDMLEANIGKEVELWIQDRKEWSRYTILDIPKRHDEPILQPRPMNSLPIIPPPERGEIVLLQGPEAREAIPLHWIEAIRTYTKDQVIRPSLENVVQFSATPTETGKPTDVSLTYLAKGLAWTPSYVLDIGKEKTAVITAKAIIVNDLQPLEHTGLELITGYPNIAFSEIGSSFSLTPLQQILDQIREGQGREEMAFKNFAIVSQRAMFDAPAAPPLGMPSAPATPVMGESAEDLYFYQIPDVTLKKGERGYYPLFTAEVPYEHLYTWDIPQSINENANYQEQPQDSAMQTVWHALKLTNTTPHPWTSAPAATLKDGRILGQDTLFYTAIGQSTELKITRAVSLNAEQNEYEIERQRSAAQFYGRNYDLVSVQGELAVTNFKNEEVVIEIKKNLKGEIQKYDGEPKIQRLAKGLSSVNPDTQVIWKLPVKPGKDNSLKLTYVYQIYIRG